MSRLIEALGPDWTARAWLLVAAIWTVTGAAALAGGLYALAQGLLP